MKEVHLVIGSTCPGEPDGCYEHVYRAFADKTAAELAALEMNELAHQIYEIRDLADWNNKELMAELTRLEKEMTDRDKMVEHYTYCTDYSVSTFEIN